MNEFQRTAEWYAERTGKLTASRAYAATARSKRDGSKLKAYQDLLAEVVCERVSGMAVQHNVTDAMLWGMENEDAAIAAYEEETGRVVQRTGFILHPEHPMLGASPDGLVGEDGLVEVKCPATMTHLERLRTRDIPEQYRVQMQVQMLCTGRRWCDFVDFDPRLCGEWEAGRLLIVRYEPEAGELERTLAMCLEFLEDVEEQMAALAEIIKTA